MSFKALKTHSLNNVLQFAASTSAEPLTLESPAWKVVTDFTRRNPQIIDKDVSVDQTLFMMKKGHVKSLLVVDADHQFLGVISFADLTSRKVLMIAAQKGLERQDLCVEDLMVTREHLHGIPYDRILNACIGDVVHTLRTLGEQHILLVDRDEKIRGLISAADIARALHIPLDIAPKAHSFKDIFDVLHEHRELA
ncbi:CBS domain-containing protein [Bowmanella dokdonensis]|uniref:CBS domain-containing protein n=1 Tax=Bowmanella dokdonensis TaxID=751969 RepID=A0A939DSQ0_9ALTE|nr:CBS domain-containing protein [Bowmanella dokdonensis]MBN7827500.1 CBS domain-containing protein [Bowmanella dokdonensis]